jgi:hypothetical protein
LKSDDAVAAVLDDATTTKGDSTTTNNVTIGTILVSVTTLTRGGESYL